MKMEPIVSSETSAIRTQTPGNYPKRNKLHLEHGESLKTRFIHKFSLKKSSRLKGQIYFKGIRLRWSEIGAILRSTVVYEFLKSDDADGVVCVGLQPWTS